MKTFFANISVTRYLVLALTLIMLSSSLGCYYHRHDSRPSRSDGYYDRGGRDHDGPGRGRPSHGGGPRHNNYGGHRR